MAERVTFTPDELLADPAVGDPLYAGDMRCHGGFDADGNYTSPRTLHRNPAIHAWAKQVTDAGGSLVTLDPALIPPQYPNASQAKLLLRNGVREPMVRALTGISIVEGFGAVIRDVPVPDLSELIVEPIEGTALAHLDQGLFEAHARDEAGWGEHGGHKQMWEAARDLGLENPKVPGDVLMRMTSGRRSNEGAARPYPELDPKLERMLMTMAQVLVVEHFAAAVFAWGEEVLSDPEVSAAPDQAAAMVRYIRADETPHVDYLRTALSELRLRSVRTVQGKVVSGSDLVDSMLHRMLRQVISDRPGQQRDQLSESLAASIARAANPTSLREEFDSLERTWDRPSLTGFEPAA
jgi:hypothetical protein